MIRDTWGPPSGGPCPNPAKSRTPRLPRRLQPDATPTTPATAGRHVYHAGYSRTPARLTGFPATDSFRQVMQQLQDVGKDAHRGDVGAGAGALHDQRRSGIALRS